MDIVRAEKKVIDKAKKMYCPKRNDYCVAGECWAFKFESLLYPERAYGKCWEYEENAIIVTLEK